MLEDYKATLKPEIKAAQLRMMRLEIQHDAATTERAQLIAQDAGEVDVACELELILEMLDDLVKEGSFSGSV